MPTAPHRALRAAVLVLGLAAAACGADEPTADAGSSLASADRSSSAAAAASSAAPPGGGGARAELRDPSGEVVGTVTFAPPPDASGAGAEGGALVSVDVTSGGDPGVFHGLHVHANDDPANGEGCVADPAAPPADWFTSADGHLADVGSAAEPAGTHGAHAGDLPPLLVLADGTASAETTTDRFTAADVVGAAVVLHAGPDNLGHVPTGPADDRYTANALAALDVTRRTGNAGPRIACGTIAPT